MADMHDDRTNKFCCAQLQLDSVHSSDQFVEQDKNVRRENANSNERRRMQSINAGFNALRDLLPASPNGDKLSKATVLQVTAKYIESLQNEVKHLNAQLSQVRQIALEGSTESSSLLLPHCINNIPINNNTNNTNNNKKRVQYQYNNNTTTSSLTQNQLLLPSVQQCKQQRVINTPDLCLLNKNSLTNYTIDTNSSVNYIHLAATSYKPDYELYVVKPSIAPNSQSFSINQTIYSPTSCVFNTDVASNSTGRRLEHLMMAIEQIEGGVNNSEVNTSGSNIRRCETLPSNNLQLVTLSSSCELNNSSSQNSDCDMMDVSLLNNDDQINLIAPVTISSSSSEDYLSYPAVVPSKSLTHCPIPHKYLHRPQVVTNNTCTNTTVGL